MSKSNPYAAKSKAEKKAVEAPEETTEEPQAPAPHPEEVESVEDTQETSEEAPEEVPDGTTDEVLEWVGEDKDRAKLALESEQNGKKRKGLLRELEELV